MEKQDRDKRSLQGPTHYKANSCNHGEVANHRQELKENFIQQDDAKNHICEDDKLLNDALDENGVNAELYTQSANSPDINLFDLGFFRDIQSFNDAALRNEEELIEAVSDAYDKYPREKSIELG